jgi:L-ascorbate metabolism protein UlaG (beta-lactamase superfamily)
MAAIKLSGGRLIDEVDETRPEAGVLAFWWLGQNGFIYKGGNTVLYVDVYLSPNARRRTLPPLKPAEITNATAVLCSHDHSDHLDPGAIPGMAAASPNALFVMPRAATQRMRSLGVPGDRLRPLNDGESVEIAGARVLAVKSKHEFFHEHPQLGFPYLGFVVDLNGVRFYHAGDTITYDGLLTRLQELKPHVVFLPINGRDAVRYRTNCIGNMTFQEAVDLAGEAGARLAVPMHYDMFATNSEDPQKFVSYLNAKFPGVNTWVGPIGEKVEVRV